MEREVLNQVNKEDMYKMHWSDISEHEEFKKGLKKYPKSLHKEENSKTNKKKNTVHSVQFSCCRNQYSRNQAPHSESWRIQVYYAGGPRGVSPPSSEP